MPEPNPTDRLDILFDALDLGVVVLDDQERVVAWNAWLAAAAAISKQAAIGQRLDRLFPGDQIALVVSAVAASFGSGASRLLTHTLHPALFPLKTRAGQPLIHDVTIR